MAHRIEVGLKEKYEDPRGNRILRLIELQFPQKIKKIRLVDVYTINGNFERNILETMANQAFVDPVINEWCIDELLKGEFDWIVEVGLRPGVTDNVGRTAAESINLILSEKGFGTTNVKVAHSIQYRITSDNLERHEIEKIASDFFFNSLIQRSSVYSRDELRKKGKIEPYFPEVTETFHPKVEFFDLETMNEDMLAELSQKRVLSLTVPEMKAIREYFAREDVKKMRNAVGIVPHPTDVELECIAQTWSEHCKHKIFNATIFYVDEEKGVSEKIESLFKTTIVETTEEVRKDKGQNDFCLSVFKDNAGVIKFDENHVIAFKVETHNSPSALDPYGGALTGIVGVNRDPLGTGMGMNLFCNTNVFCLGYPDFSGILPPRVLHPMRILEGVREGVEHGGNKSGIPTINGSVVFDERFTARPLVYCGTGGVAPIQVAGRPSYKKKARPGDIILMVGGKIGKDGIHGATFSSVELSEGSPVSAVQIGDPITQKRMSDFLYVCRDEGLYNSITDNGAGGLSSSIGEMALESGGAEVDLSPAPLKYPGLHPWEIFLSEAQERMTLAVPPEKLQRVLELADKMFVQATPLGTFNDSGLLVVKYHNEIVAMLHLDFLHNGVPTLTLHARWNSKYSRVQVKDPLPVRPKVEDLPKILARPNVASKEYWVRQYDHEVGGGSVVKPLCGPLGDGPSDAAVTIPVIGGDRGVVVSHGICPRYSDADTYSMAMCAVDEAVRNAISVGADPSKLAALDNFCWSDPVASPTNPDGEFKLAQLVRACKGLKDICIAYGIPLISGKDSMKNDYRHESIHLSIPPTLLVTLLGIVEDPENAITMYAKAPGDLVYVLGKTRDELGCSEWANMYSIVSGKSPEVRFSETVPLYDSLHRAIKSGVVRSCHDASDGGIGVAIAETAFAGGLGMEIDLNAVPCEGVFDEGTLLFSESAGRFVVTVDPADCERFEKIMEGHPFAKIGVVTYGNELILKGFNKGVEWKWGIEDLKKVWKSTLAF